jgi:hypothetical protein
MMKNNPPAIGARVQRTRKFLKSIGMPATDPIWREHGTVTEHCDFVSPSKFVKVRWDGEDDDKMILAVNIGVGYLANID